MNGMGGWPVFDAYVAWDVAQGALIAANLSDGLPLAVPTADRCAAMLEGAADPTINLGHMPPLFGDLTLDAIAYNCVIAGCAPGALPVVATAAAATLEAEFNLLGLATTTGSPAVAAVVHGPIAPEMGMNAGVNCLAPGNAANATIGRAIALVLRNIGGMRTGAGDMATMGQPGKYGLCFPEGDDRTFLSFHVRRGFEAGDSAVTVLGVTGTSEVLPAVEDGNWDTPEAVLEPVALTMHAHLVAGGSTRKTDAAEQVLLLPPELAGLIADRGWSMPQIEMHLADRINDKACGAIDVSPDHVHVIVTGGPGTKMTVLPLWGGGSRAVTRKLMAL